MNLGKIFFIFSLNNSPKNYIRASLATPVAQAASEQLLVTYVIISLPPQALSVFPKIRLSASSSKEIVIVSAQPLGIAYTESDVVALRDPESAWSTK